MEKANDLLAGFGSLLQNVKAQQSSWTTHVKFGSVRYYHDMVDAVRGAFIAQSVLTGIPIKEEEFTFSKWPDLTFGEPLYISDHCGISKFANSVFMYSETNAVCVVIGPVNELTEVLALCDKAKLADDESAKLKELLRGNDDQFESVV